MAIISFRFRQDISDAESQAWLETASIICLQLNTTEVPSCKQIPVPL